MASLGREVQRAKLHQTIWKVANDLRGSVDGWDFKAYVLGMLFYRFISESIAYYIEQDEDENFSSLICLMIWRKRSVKKQ